MLFILQLLFFVSVAALVYGIAKKSFLYLLVSTLTSLPIAYLFLYGVNNGWKYIGLLPIVLLALTVIFWRKTKKRWVW
ncbi:hypothetical protein [Planococcus lenghuensis]|uniref:Uncharacterized protein n=1 Tax=Planococcus lenghuensis TaxID=2213202 RepID=A0A1Q2KY97_9BACL|nr:hypothetical protein [Planococcus lenghuensis]AQQ53123.1 hypothetical protein B0X71_08460 [Planococcus lenghuensis]